MAKSNGTTGDGSDPATLSFIGSVLASLVAVPSEQAETLRDFNSHLKTDDTVRTFLTSTAEEHRVLQVAMTKAPEPGREDRWHARIQTTMGFAEVDADYVVLLEKKQMRGKGGVRPAPPDMFHIHHIAGSPLNTLTSSLHAVYLPLMQGGDGKTNAPFASLASKMQKAVAARTLTGSGDLYESSASRLGSGDKTDPSAASQGSWSKHGQYASSRSLQEEFSFWQSVIACDGGVGGMQGDSKSALLISSTSREEAHQVATAIHTMLKGFQRIEGVESAEGDCGAREEEVLEHIDSCREELEAIWLISLNGDNAGSTQTVPAFPQRRMEHLMTLLVSEFLNEVYSRLLRVNIWAQDRSDRQPRTGVSTKRLMKMTMRILAKLEETMYELTGHLGWAGASSSGRKWEGVAFESYELVTLRRRLKVAIKLVESHDDLISLLDPEELLAFSGSSITHSHDDAIYPGASESVRGSAFFKSFAQNSFDPRHVTDDTFSSSLEDYNISIKPVEERVAQKLKLLLTTRYLPQLKTAIEDEARATTDASDGSGHETMSISKKASTAVRPHQLFKEMKRYYLLFSRPVISELLREEFDAIDAFTITYVQRIRDGVEERAKRLLRTRQASASSSTTTTTAPVEHVSWCRQMHEKLRSAKTAYAYIHSSSTGLGSENKPSQTGDVHGAGDALSSASAFQSVYADTYRNLNEFETEQFGLWQDTMMQRINTIKLEENSKLISIDARDGRIRLLYNDALSQLVREVRQFSSLGYRLDEELVREMDIARKMYHYGMVLNQVSSFYNNIESQMIPSQKAMMLSDAREFEATLMNPKDSMGKHITWNDRNTLDDYISRLERVASRLTNKNRKLRRLHAQLSQMVVSLFDVDLVRQKERFGKGVKELREVFHDLDLHGNISLESQSTWRTHWDYQLYKALEYQYSRGLEMLNETLPRIEIKLVFRQKKLSFDPPIEEVRSGHYRSIKAFVGIPINMKGVSKLSEKPGFFRGIVDANMGKIVKLYEKTEHLFGQMMDEKRKMQDWVAIGMCGGPGICSIEELITEHFKSTEDWEANIRHIKLVGRESNRIPDHVSIDCFTLSLVPVKEMIESHLRHLHDTIISMLRQGIANDKVSISEFVEAGEKLLRCEINSIEEIGRARNNARTLVREMDTVESLFQKISDKNRLLKMLVGSASSMASLLDATNGSDGTSRSSNEIDVSALHENWDKFTRELQQHEKHLEGQKDMLKQNIVTRSQQLLPQLESIEDRWRQYKPARDGDVPEGDIDLILRPVKDIKMRLNDLEVEANVIKEDSEHFDMRVEELDKIFNTIEEVREDIERTETAWSTYIAFMNEMKVMADREWIDMRRTLYVIEDFVRKWQHQLLASDTHSPSRSSADQDKSATASGSQTRIQKKDPVSIIILERLDTYKRVMPHLKYMSGYGWETIHWNMLFSMLSMPSKGVDAVTLDTLTLRHFLDRTEKIISHADDIRELCQQAEGEAVVRDALSQLKVWRLERTFTLVKHSSQHASGVGAIGRKTASGPGKTTALIKVWSDIITEVGDNQSLVQSLQDSPYYSNFKDEVQAWDARLMRLSERLSQLNNIQRKWVYLEPIFSRGALPHEQLRFERVDEDFQMIMAGIEQNPNVIALAEESSRLDRLEHLNAELDVCQRALSDFLEEKRREFSRFYFIGDEDLLEILGQSRNARVIQTHLKKLFAGIFSVCFVDDGNGGEETANFANNATVTDITGMCSANGERVQLLEPLRTGDVSVETWLRDLEVSMKATLAESLVCSLRSDSLNIEKFSGQVLCLSESIAFTSDCEKAIQNNSVVDLQRKIRTKLAQYTSLASNRGINGVSSLKLRNLILDLIHMSDIVQQLLQHRCEGVEDWMWFKQMRYYHTKSSSSSKSSKTTTTAANGRKSECSVVMAGSSFEYTYEYLGNMPKLVYTPLTDKCYLTLTQGMSLGYGGNPYGPAGTGKTESVKALGQCLGRQVLVFNCDEQFDYRSMGRIFIGLVQCGAWGCFDEFNRLEEDVLSAVSSQIQVIQDCLKLGRETLSLVGREVKINNSSAIFVTMNPAGKGYGGRSKLPDNLKQLFRSVAMSRPDNDLIAEVMLLSDGYVHAKVLGKKLVSLFTLSSQLLSKQQHYDWGLRALKVVLTVAGELKGLEQKPSDGSAGSDRETLNDGNEGADEAEYANEASLVVLAARDSTKPKLAMEDESKFDALLADLFRGVQASDINDARLTSAIMATMDEMGLERNAAQLDKVMQFHMACMQRIGVILVGPSGSGKSTIWKILKGAYSRLKDAGNDDAATGSPGIGAGNESVPIVHYMNPKAVPRQQLLGYMNLDTREFTDGILTASARQSVRESPQQRSWIICDGDIDPEWVESLNSVLDDNRLLTLPNGERIQFGKNVNFIFETHSLEFASPATISRCGMIYLSEDPQLLRDAIATWIRGLRAKADQSSGGVALGVISVLEGWAKEFFVNAIDTVSNGGAALGTAATSTGQLEASSLGGWEGGLMVPTSKMGVFHSICSHIEAVLEAGGAREKDVACAFVLGLAANVCPGDRDKVAKLVSRWTGQHDAESVLRSDSPYTRVYDAWTARQTRSKTDRRETDGRGSAHGGHTQQGSGQQQTYMSGESLVIIPQVRRAMSLVSPWLLQGAPFILAGPSGAGKRTMLVDCFQRMCGSVTIASVACNAQTTTQHIITKLMQICGPPVNSREGLVLQPRDVAGGGGDGTVGRKVVLFLQDINLPRCDKYKSSQVSSFLHQLINYNGFYDVASGSGSSDANSSANGAGSLDFIRVKNLQVIGSMSMSSAGGGTEGGSDSRGIVVDNGDQHPLSKRLTTGMRVAFNETPPRAELEHVFKTLYECSIGRKRGWTAIDSRDMSRCMLDVYEGALRIFGPGSACHYVFTPRHVTEWLRGLKRYLLSDTGGGGSEVTNGNACAVECIAYEGSRVFRNCLVGEEPKRQLDNIMEVSLKQNLSDAVASLRRSGVSPMGSSYKRVFTTYAVSLDSDDDEEGTTGDASIRSSASASFSSVLGAMDKDEYRQQVASKLLQYERETMSLGIELFDEVLMHVASLERALSRHAGAVLALGSNGVGRRSCVTLASYMLHLEIMSPKISKGYNIDNFRNELRAAILKCAVDDSKVCFLVEEYQLIEGVADAILDDVSSLLTSSEVCGLFGTSDIDTIMAQLKTKASQGGGAADAVSASSHTAVSEHIRRKVAENLRLVVILDPTAASFALRCRSQPALLSHCHIVHFDDWNAAGMRVASLSVLRSRLDDSEKSEDRTLRDSRASRVADTAGSDMEQQKEEDSMWEMVESDMFLSKFGQIHADVLHPASVGRCPRQLIRMVRYFKDILSLRASNARQQASHLRAGLMKLAEASSRVDTLSREAARQRQLLATKQQEAENALGAITTSMTRANESRNEISILQKRLGEEEIVLESKRDNVEQRLSKVRPLVEEAKKAVGSIRKDNLNEIRSMKSPPDAIRDVLEGVLLLMGQADTSWVSMKKFLGQTGVKDQILNYDARNISKDIRSNVEGLLKTKAKSFDASVIHRVSLAAAPLAGWVKANVQYSHALETVKPLESSLKELVAGLEASKVRVRECEQELEILDGKVVELKEDFARRTGEAEQLKLSLKAVTAQLEAAEVLLGKLGGEKERWQTQLETLQVSLSKIPMNSLVTAAFMTYLSGEPEDVRRLTLRRWTSLLRNDTNEISSATDGSSAGSEFSFRSFMTTESETLSWKADGLPDDDLSIENAVTILQGVDVPYVVDPSTRTANWLKRLLKKGKSVHNGDNIGSGAASGKLQMDVTTLQDPRFLKTLELAVRFGKTLIIEEVDVIDSVLIPLIRREFTQYGSRLTVNIGEKNVDFNPQFRLYLFTRNPNPRLPTYVRALVNVINFTTTRSGLVGQLLALTISHEQPELEEQKSKLLRREEELTVQLADLQRSLLHELASSEGDILENRALIDSLNETKAKSVTIAESLKEAAVLQVDLDEKRETYRPVAAKGSELFFIIRELKIINHMYQFSLKSFLNLYAQALAFSPPSSSSSSSSVAEGVGTTSMMLDVGGDPIGARVRNLQRVLLDLAYAEVAMALFQEDRQTFGMHLARSVKANQSMESASSTSTGMGSSTRGGDFGMGTDEEWDAFTASMSSSSPQDAENAGLRSPQGGTGIVVPQWVPLEKRPALQTMLSRCGSAQMAMDRLGLEQENPWTLWLHSATPEASFPDPTSSRASPLLRLGMLAAVRPDRISAGVTHTIKSALGLSTATINAQHLNVTHILDAKPLTPLLLVTTAGADPSSEIHAMAEAELSGTGRQLMQLAMGQGQAEAAMQSLHACAVRGDWLMLKNLHLVIAWLDVLEKAVYRLSGSEGDAGQESTSPSSEPKVHKDFRLILTTEAHGRFPSSLLQLCKKVTVEAPPGIKQNMQRNFTTLRNAGLFGGTQANVSQSQLMFMLCWFHAVIQERRTYIPQGWSKFYEFSFADLRSGSDVLSLSMRARGDADVSPRQWRYLHGVLESAIYGGRVDNSSDMQILLAYIRQTFCDGVIRKQCCLPGTRIQVPSSSFEQDFQNAIAGVPDVDTHTMFGLPANIGFAVQLECLMRLKQNIRSLDVVGGLTTDSNTGDDASGSGTVNSIDLRSSENWREKLAPTMRIWQRATKQPQVLTLLQGGSLPPADGNYGDRSRAETSPIRRFILSERRCIASLLSTIAAPMRLLEKAIGQSGGEGTMSATVEEVGAALIMGAVPASWSDVWDGPSEATEYLAAIARMATKTEMWQRKIDSGELLSTTSSAHGAEDEAPLALSDLMNPLSFLNALRQQAAEEHGVSMDQLSLRTMWMSGSATHETSSLGRNVVVLSGLLIQGAIFCGTGNGQLEDVRVDTPPVSRTPSVCFSWQPTATDSQENATIRVPCYSNQSRERHVMDVEVPCPPIDREKWSLTGLAVFIM